MPNSYSKVAATRAQLLRLLDHLDSGEALPPERELAIRLGVARMTLRRATDELVLAGLVTREHGRGTFAVHPKMTQQMAMTSFSDAMRQRGVEPGSRVLEFRTLRAGGYHNRSLRIPALDPVVRFARVRMADGEPIGLETTFVAAARVPGLTREDLIGSWYELLASRYRMQIMTGTSVIEIVQATEREAAQLRCPVGSSLFRIETTSYGTGGHVVDFGVDLLRGDRYVLTTERISGSRVVAQTRRTDRPRPGRGSED